MLQRHLLIATIVVLSVAAAAVDATHDHNGISWKWDSDLGGQSLNEVFSRCICWNTTSSNWCYADDTRDGQTYRSGGASAFWARRSCQQLVTQLYWWVLPAVFLMAFFVLFPIFFCLSRLLCNCCGGRNPTYGCCCPVNNKVIHAAQLQGVKNFKRPYSRCTTGWAKFLALAALVAAITVCVHGFIGSAGSKHAVQDLAVALNDTVSDMESGADACLATLTNLTERNLTHVDLSTLASDKKEYERVTHEISRVIHGMNKDESGAFNWSIRIIALPLFIIAIVTILAFCNVRGCVISLAMGILSFLALFLCIIWIVAIAFSETMHVACDNYDTFAPFVVDMIQDNRYCGSVSAIDGINRTETIYLTALCNQAGLASACASGALSCPVNACIQGTYVTGKQEVFVDVTAIVQTLALARTADGKNISACAADISCAAHDVALALSTVANNYASSVLVLHNEFTELYNCNGLRSDFQTFLYQPLCNSLVPQAHRLSTALLGLTLVMFFTMFIWIYGAKRFTKGSTCDDMERYQELMQQPVVHPQDEMIVNTVPAHQAHCVESYSSKEEPLLPAASNFVANYGSSTTTSYTAV